MAVLALLALALFAGTACAAPSDTNRIVGGWPTSVERYPSIVQVEFWGVFTGHWSQSCAANILSSRYVLSAAHCFEGFYYYPEFRRIRAGSTMRNTGGFLVNVEREFNHPSYGQLDLDGDITVVRLSTALVFSPVVQPISILAQGTEIPDGLPVQHAGWGATQQSGSASNVLLETTIFTVNRELCAARYWNTIPRRPVTENMICAGLLDIGGRDACQGDSGGPMYFNEAGGGDVLVGIVSWGQGCARAEFPGVSTRISSYTDWIVRTAS